VLRATSPIALAANIGELVLERCPRVLPRRLLPTSFSALLLLPDAATDAATAAAAALFRVLRCTTWASLALLAVRS
jgi:hypothetical protein